MVDLNVERERDCGERKDLPAEVHGSFAHEILERRPNYLEVELLTKSRLGSRNGALDTRSNLLLGEPNSTINKMSPQYGQCRRAKN